MNEQELNEIEARAEAATPGVVTAEEYTDIFGDNSYQLIRDDDGVSLAESMTAKDCVFFLHARQDVPALVAEVRRLNRELAQMKVIDAAIERDNSDIRKENAKLRAIIGEAIEWYECGEMNRLEQALKGGAQ